MALFQYHSVEIVPKKHAPGKKHVMYYIYRLYIYIYNIYIIHTCICRGETETMVQRIPWIHPLSKLKASFWSKMELMNFLLIKQKAARGITLIYKRSPCMLCGTRVQKCQERCQTNAWKRRHVCTVHKTKKNPTETERSHNQKPAYTNMESSSSRLVSSISPGMYVLVSFWTATISDVSQPSFFWDFADTILSTSPTAPQKNGSICQE